MATEIQTLDSPPKSPSTDRLANSPSKSSPTAATTVAVPEPPPASGDDVNDVKDAGAPLSSGSSVANTAPASDVEKKMRRAERFGVAVQLSEQEKRNSRAERFGTVSGTGSTLHGSDTLKKSEDQKRKARAQRFGLPAQTGATDEEAKKKARLERFAPGPTTSTLEDDKKKARALRFSKPSSGSLSQVKVEGNIQPKTAIAGKASGGA